MALTFLTLPTELRLMICRFALAGTNFALWLCDGHLGTIDPNHDEYDYLEHAVFTDPDPKSLLLVCKTLEKELSPIFYECVGVQIDIFVIYRIVLIDPEQSILKKTHLPSLCNKVQRLTLSIGICFGLGFAETASGGLARVGTQLDIDQAFPRLRELVIYEDDVSGPTGYRTLNHRSARNMKDLVLLMAMLGTRLPDYRSGRAHRYRVLQQLRYSRTQVSTTLCIPVRAFLMTHGYALESWRRVSENTSTRSAHSELLR